MSKNDWKGKIKQKLDEINRKIDLLKTEDLHDTTLKDQVEGLIRKLETIRNDIKEKYAEADTEREDVWERMEKDIYSDFESFDEAFRKAGTLFRREGKKLSDDPGHFYRPGDETI
jgi:uncharacterized protein YoxC